MSHSETSVMENWTRRRVLQSSAALATSPLISRIALAAGSGGTLVWGKSLETTMIDPHTALVGSAWQLHYLVYETLTSMGDTFDVQAGLAESWDIPSPTKYVFNLREGVAFSNGRPMTAEDVAGSISRVVDPKFGSWWASQMGSVKSVIVADPKTVVIELNEPFTPLLASLAASMTAILPIKELEEGTFDPTKEMLGTGPFMVTAHQQNDFWTLARNPHYWRQGYPKFDEVSVRIITDDSARLAALESAPSKSPTLRTRMRPFSFRACQTSPQWFRIQGICTRSLLTGSGRNRRFAIRACARRCSSQSTANRFALLLSATRGGPPVSRRPCSRTGARRRQTPATLKRQASWSGRPAASLSK